MDRSRLRRHARIALLVVPGLTIFNLLSMAIFGGPGLTTTIPLQSCAAVIALIARYLITGRARRHPELVLLVVTTSATVASAVVGILEPPLANFSAVYLMLIPLAVAMLIPWQPRPHLVFLVIHAAVTLPAIAIMAAPSATQRMELLVVSVSSVVLSMVGKQLASREDRRSFAMHRALVMGRTQLGAANRALAQSLRHDPMTGARNRLRLAEDLLVVRSEISRNAEPWGLLALDLDGFKSINDSFGHGAGDKALCTSVQAMRATLRPTDGLYRIGGEEFAVLLARLPEPGVTAVAERLRQSVADLAIPNPSSHSQGFLTVSVGVTLLDSQSLSMDDDGWLARADRAVYTAKAEGRNRVVTAGNLPPPAQHGAPIERDVPRAGGVPRRYPADGSRAMPVGGHA